MSSAINQSLIDGATSEVITDKVLKESVISNFVHSRESVMNKARPTQLFLFQSLAMFIFAYGYTCYTTKFEVDAQVAGSVLLAVCFAGTLSGANINPAVTLSNCIKKQNKYKPMMFLVLVGAQLSGSLLGLLFADFANDVTLPSLLLPNDAMGVVRVILNEAMGVWFLIFFLLQISNPNTTFIENELSGFFSIALFYHIGRSFSPLASKCINPGLSIPMALQSAIKGYWLPMRDLWAWLLGDLIGAVTATLFYDMVYEPIVKQLRQIRRKSQNFQSITEQTESERTFSESSRFQ